MSFPKALKFAIRQKKFEILKKIATLKSQSSETDDEDEIDDEPAAGNSDNSEGDNHGKAVEPENSFVTYFRKQALASPGKYPENILPSANPIEANSELF